MQGLCQVGVGVGVVFVDVYVDGGVGVGVCVDFVLYLDDQMLMLFSPF